MQLFVWEAGKSTFVFNDPVGKLQQNIAILWKKLRTKDTFVQNSAYMFSASMWGMAIQFLFAPFLSRIYGPEEYGLFGILNSWIAVISVFVGLGYTQAFVLPESNKKFRALLGLTIKSSFWGSLIAGIIFLAFWKEINLLSGAVALGKWTILVGPLVFLVAADGMLMEWCIRLKAFKKLSIYSIPVQLGAKGFNLGYGCAISNTVEGLIISHLITFIIRIYLYGTRVVTGTINFLKTKPSTQDWNTVKSEYRAYPRLVMWSSAMNTFSNYLPILVLPIILGNARSAGLFTFAILILDIPARLLGAGISKVYLQKAVELKKQSGDLLAQSTSKIHYILVVVIALPLMILGMEGERVYSLIFGEEWSDSGKLAAIMAAFYFFKLSSAPISSIFNVMRKEVSLFWFQLTLLLLRLAALLVSGMIGLDLTQTIVAFTLANILGYLLLTGWIFVLVGNYFWKSVLFSLLIFSLATGVVLWWRFG